VPALFFLFKDTTAEDKCAYPTWSQRVISG
jgi:hypothetical protein